MLANGTEEQIGTWVPQMYGDADDVKVAAFCSSEPDAGSDVAAMRTRAVYDEATDEWVLNGTKTWATNGGIANVHVVVAVVDPELGSKGHASFIVPPGTPGLSQGQKFKKHGIRASHTAEVVLEDVRVPGDCLLGGKDKLDERLARARERARSGGGERVKNAAMATFEASRPAVGAMAVGIARAAYEYALEYAKTREQFGRPIIDNQGVAFQLADMRTQIDAARLLVWRASWMATAGQPVHLGRGLDVQALRQRDRQEGHRRRPSRSSAATATPASTRSSGCTGTAPSTRSSRAPARSSGWSSPAPCPACRSADPAAAPPGRRCDDARAPADGGRCPGVVVPGGRCGRRGGRAPDQSR